MELIGKYVIIRTFSAGVFAGTLASRDGKEAVLTDARRIWLWSGAATLSELAMRGTSDPDGCKFPCPVSLILVTEVIEIILCSAEGEASIREVPEWTVH